MLGYLRVITLLLYVNLALRLLAGYVQALKEAAENPDSNYWQTHFAY